MGFTETEDGPRSAAAGPTATTPPRPPTGAPPGRRSATQQEPSVGFTETDCGSENAPLADRHSSAPAADRCTTWPWE